MSSTPVTFSELEAAAKAPVTTEQTPTTAATETKTETTQAQETPQFTEADVTALRTLTDLGITPANAQQFIQAKQVLERLPEMLRTNPRLVTAEMAKSDPEGYKRFLDKVSDEWYEVTGQYLEPQAAQGRASSTAPSADPRMESKLTELQTKLDSMVAERNQEKSARQQQSITEGYNSAVDELLGKLPKETPELTKDHIRLKTNELLWKDTAARDRVSKGVYVDLSSHFAKACNLVTADTKAAASREHERRSDVESRGGREVVPAAENVNGSVQPRPGEDPIWGDTAMASDVKKALAAR